MGNVIKKIMATVLAFSLCVSFTPIAAYGETVPLQGYSEDDITQYQLDSLVGLSQANRGSSMETGVYIITQDTFQRRFKTDTKASITDNGVVTDDLTSLFKDDLEPGKKPTTTTTITMLNSDKTGNKYEPDYPFTVTVTLRQPIPDENGKTPSETGWVPTYIELPTPIHVGTINKEDINPGDPIQYKYDLSDDIDGKIRELLRLGPNDEIPADTHLELVTQVTDHRGYKADENIINLYPGISSATWTGWTRWVYLDGSSPDYVKPQNGRYEYKQNQTQPASTYLWKMKVNGADDNDKQTGINNAYNFIATPYNESIASPSGTKPGYYDKFYNEAIKDGKLVINTWSLDMVPFSHNFPGTSFDVFTTPAVSITLDLYEAYNGVGRATNEADAEKLIQKIRDEYTLMRIDNSASAVQWINPTINVEPNKNPTISFIIPIGNQGAGKPAGISVKSTDLGDYALVRNVSSDYEKDNPPTGSDYQKYTVTPEATTTNPSGNKVYGGGQITPATEHSYWAYKGTDKDPIKMAAASNPTYTIMPDEGYEIDEVVLTAKNPFSVDFGTEDHPDIKNAKAEVVGGKTVYVLDITEYVKPGNSYTFPPDWKGGDATLNATFKKADPVQDENKTYTIEVQFKGADGDDVDPNLGSVAWLGYTSIDNAKMAKFKAGTAAHMDFAHGGANVEITKVTMTPDGGNETEVSAPNGSLLIPNVTSNILVKVTFATKIIQESPGTYYNATITNTAPDNGFVYFGEKGNGKTQVPLNGTATAQILPIALAEVDTATLTRYDDPNNPTIVDVKDLIKGNPGELQTLYIYNIVTDVDLNVTFRAQPAHLEIPNTNDPTIPDPDHPGQTKDNPTYLPGGQMYPNDLTLTMDPAKKNDPNDSDYPEKEIYVSVWPGYTFDPDDSHMKIVNKDEPNNEDKQIKLKFEPAYERDENGNILKDEDGNPIEKHDENGFPMYVAKVTYEDMRDIIGGDGELVLIDNEVFKPTQETIKWHYVFAQAEGEGIVSPESSLVQPGASAKVYIYPKQGHKIESLTVEYLSPKDASYKTVSDVYRASDWNTLKDKNGNNVGPFEYDVWDNNMFVVPTVSSDMRIIAHFAEGENEPPTVKDDDIKTPDNNGNIYKVDVSWTTNGQIGNHEGGNVSPRSTITASGQADVVEILKGSTQTFNFFPKVVRDSKGQIDADKSYKVGTIKINGIIVATGLTSYTYIPNTNEILEEGKQHRSIEVDFVTMSTTLPPLYPNVVVTEIKGIDDIDKNKKVADVVPVENHVKTSSDSSFFFTLEPIDGKYKYVLESVEAQAYDDKGDPVTDLDPANITIRPIGPGDTNVTLNQNSSTVSINANNTTLGAQESTSDEDQKFKTFLITVENIKANTKVIINLKANSNNWNLDDKKVATRSIKTRSIGGGYVYPIEDVEVPKNFGMKATVVPFNGYYIKKAILTTYNTDKVPADITQDIAKEETVTRDIVNNAYQFPSTTIDGTPYGSRAMMLTVEFARIGNSELVDVYLDRVGDKHLYTVDPLVSDEGTQFARNTPITFLFKPKNPDGSILLDKDGNSYVIDKLYVNDVEQYVVPGANFATLTFAEDKNYIKVSFRELNGDEPVTPPQTFTFDIGDPEGGSIVGPNPVVAGDSPIYVYQPDEPNPDENFEWALDKIIVDDVEVFPNFDPEDPNNIDPTVPGGHKIVQDGRDPNNPNLVNYTIVKTGEKFVVDESKGTITFINVRAPHKLDGKFIRLVRVEVTYGGGGYIVPSGDNGTFWWPLVDANTPADLTMYVVENPNYELEDVTVNESSVHKDAKNKRTELLEDKEGAVALGNPLQGQEDSVKTDALTNEIQGLGSYQGPHHQLNANSYSLNSLTQRYNLMTGEAARVYKLEMGAQDLPPTGAERVVKLNATYKNVSPAPANMTTIVVRANGQGSVVNGTKQIELSIPVDQPYTLTYKADNGYKVLAIAKDKQNIDPTKEAWTQSTYVFTPKTDTKEIDVYFGRQADTRLTKYLSSLAQTGELNLPAALLLTCLACGAFGIAILAAGRRRKDDEEEEETEATLATAEA